MVPETIEGYELSPQQKRIWSLQRREGGFFFWGRHVLRVDGDLEPGILKNALGQVVERHELLRTEFRFLPGMARPLQVVSPQGESLYRTCDLRALPSAAQQAHFRALVGYSLDSQQGYRSSGPLGITHVILEPDRHFIAIEMPALAADSVSLCILAREICQSYVACRDGKPIPHPRVQYADIAQTLNECLESDRYAFARKMWRERTARMEGLPDPPFNSASDVFRLRSTDVPVGCALIARAREFSTRIGIDIEGLLLTCWGLLMCRISPAKEVTIGLCCDGRTNSILGETIGPLSRHLPFGFRSGHSDSFRELARATETRRLRFADEQHYFDPGALDTESDHHQGYTACFEYLRLLDNASATAPVFVSQSLFSICDRCPTKLTIHEDGHGLLCRLEYDSSALPESDASNIAECLAMLLESALRAPEAEVESLEIFSPGAKAELLALAKGRNVPPDSRCVHTLFEMQARDLPDSVALVFRDHQLTYGELNRRSSRLGQYLRGRGLEAEDRVGLCLERGLDMVIAILGVLKAGGVYVPIDAGFPGARVRYILQDARISLLLSQSTLLPRLPSNSSFLYLDREWDLVVQYGQSDRPSYDTPGGLAYVIYTSGSTGQPKGVGIEHRQLVNYVKAVEEVLEMQAGWRMVIVSTFGADLGHTMLFPSLCLGGELHVLSEECARDAKLWNRYASERRIDCAKMTPSHLEVLLKDGEGLPQKWLALGGEACSREWLARLSGRKPGCRFLNHYGPTECTVGAVTHRVADGEQGSVPLGRPLHNVATHVMDVGGRPLPVRVPGELYIGGACVGRGYLNQPGHTAEKFVPDGLGTQPGTRLYRTGDRVKWRADGKLEYLGRLDHQVKIRGHRVELGEIESLLVQHERIRQSVVCVDENGTGGKSLKSYVVPSEGAAVTVSEIRFYLQDSLPLYMIPSVIITLEQMPLTPNGKVDTAALRQLREAETYFDDQGPQTPEEEIVSGVFTDVLAREDIGRHQNFFDIGGHSLLAAQVISRMSQDLGVEIPLRTLFENPTVTGLGAILREARASDRHKPIHPIRPVASIGTLPLSFAQQRLWFLDRLSPGNSAFNISAAARVLGPLNVVTLENGISEIIRRNAVVRTDFVEDNGLPSQVIAAPEFFRLPITDLSGLTLLDQDACIHELAEIQALRPFNLARGPHLRVRFLATGPEEHVTLFVMHHIVSDGWSMALLTHDIQSVYEAFSQGESWGSPEPEIQYADFAVWQRDWLKGEFLDSQLQYWRRHLARRPPRLSIGSRREGPQTTSYSGAQREIRISSQATEMTRALSRQEGVTLFMTLLAAYAVLLYRCTGESDLLVGTDVANRNHGQIQKLIGFFVNQLVLRVNLSGDPTFQESLRRVREVALGAYANQDLPFDKLVEALNPERSLTGTPLFQVKIVLQNIPQFNSDPGFAPDRRLTFAPIEAGKVRTAQLDLNLIVRETQHNLIGQLRYSTEVFDEMQAYRFLKDLERILEIVGEQPAAKISTIVTLLDEAENSELIGIRNSVLANRKKRIEGSRRRLVTPLSGDEGEVTTADRS
jgi:amino acid adenylation domain-containing protein